MYKKYTYKTGHTSGSLANFMHFCPVDEVSDKYDFYIFSHFFIFLLIFINMQMSYMNDTYTYIKALLI